MDHLEEEWPINRLKPHRHQAKFFSNLSSAAFQALVDDIRANGLQHPIEITGDGTIVCGHQRVRAMQQLGLKTTKCKVYAADPLDPQMIERLVGDNLIRRQMARLDIAKLYAAMKQEPKLLGSGKLRDRVANLFGTSGRSLDSYLKVLETPVEIQYAWNRRQLTDQDVQRVRGATPAQVQQVLDRIKAGSKPKAAVRSVLGNPAAVKPTRQPGPRQTSCDVAPLGSLVQQLIVTAQSCRKQRRQQPINWDPAELTDLTSGLRSVQGLCAALLQEIGAIRSETSST